MLAQNHKLSCDPHKVLQSSVPNGETICWHRSLTGKNAAGRQPVNGAALL